MTTAKTLTFFITGLLILHPGVRGSEIEAIASRPSIDQRIDQRIEPRKLAVSPLAEIYLDRVMNRVTAPTGRGLWSILSREVPPSTSEERTFFSHRAFTGLSALERGAFFELLAQSNPRRLLRLRHGLVPAVDLRHPKAAAERLEIELISRVRAMTPNEQLSTFLGRRNGRSNSKKTRKFLSIEERVKRLGTDPAIAGNFPLIDEAWFAGLAAANIELGMLYSRPSELIQAKIMIARNLYFQEEQPTRLSVRSEYSRILRLRKHYRSFPLFSGREVVYASSDDRVGKSASYVFGRLPTRRSIEQQGAALTFLREGESRQGARAMRGRLETLLEEAPSLTFFFEGHGRRKTLKLNGGLGADSFAAALAARAQGGAEGDVAVALFVTCSGHDFTRSVLSRLEKLDPGIPKPIMISPAEFGQVWVKSVYSEPFLIQDLGLGGQTVTTLGSLFDTGMIGTSVYVPDENNVSVQIL